MNCLRVPIPIKVKTPPKCGDWVRVLTGDRIGRTGFVQREYDFGGRSGKYLVRLNGVVENNWFLYNPNDLEVI